MKFNCPHCQKVLNVKDELAGKQGKCPFCGQAATIPEPEIRVVEPEIKVLGGDAPRQGPMSPQKQAPMPDMEEPRRASRTARSRLRLILPLVGAGLVLLLLAGYYATRGPSPVLPPEEVEEPLPPELVKQIEKAIRNLSHSDVKVRRSAALILGAVRDRRAFRALADILGGGNKEDYLVSHKAAISLGRLGYEDAGPILMGILTDERRYQATRMGALTGLGTLRYKPAVPLLIKLLEDKDDSIRSEAAHALMEIGDPRAIVPLKKTGHPVEAKAIENSD